MACSGASRPAAGSDPPVTVVLLPVLLPVAAVLVLVKTACNRRRWFRGGLNVSDRPIVGTRRPAPGRVAGSRNRAQTTIWHDYWAFWAGSGLFWRSGRKRVQRPRLDPLGGLGSEFRQCQVEGFRAWRRSCRFEFLGVPALRLPETGAHCRAFRAPPGVRQHAAACGGLRRPLGSETQMQRFCWCGVASRRDCDSSVGCRDGVPPVERITALSALGASGHVFILKGACDDPDRQA